MGRHPGHMGRHSYPLLALGKDDKPAAGRSAKMTGEHHLHQLLREALRHGRAGPYEQLNALVSAKVVDNLPAGLLYVLTAPV